MNMETSLSLPLIEQNENARVWADGKTVGLAQNAATVVAKHISTSKAVSSKIRG